MTKSKLVKMALLLWRHRLCVTSLVSSPPMNLMHNSNGIEIFVVLVGAVDSNQKTFNKMLSLSEISCFTDCKFWTYLDVGTPSKHFLNTICQRYKVLNVNHNTVLKCIQRSDKLYETKQSQSD